MIDNVSSNDKLQSAPTASAPPDASTAVPSAVMPLETDRIVAAIDPVPIAADALSAPPEPSDAPKISEPEAQAEATAETPQARATPTEPTPETTSVRTATETETATQKAENKTAEKKPQTNKAPPKKSHLGLKLLLGAVVLAGFTAAVGFAAFDAVKDEAKNLPAPPLLDEVLFSTAVFSREGETLSVAPAPDGIYRVKASLADIDSDLAAATIFYEDKRFYSHPGFDTVALLRGALSTLAGGRPIGASTITMQLARMRLHLDTRTVEGKMKQIFAAMRYEAHYSKDQILEAYLNLAPYGGNIEGAGAASLLYFGKKADSLTLGEALGLAVVPQNPTKRRPWMADAVNPIWEAARRRLVKSIDTAMKESPDALPFDPVALEGAAAPVTVRDPRHPVFKAQHYVRLMERRFPGEFLKGSLSASLQSRMEALVRETVARGKPWGIQNAALCVVDSRTHQLLSLVGSADFFNDEIEGEVSAYTAKRSPGSLLKPFIYALALEQGLIHEKTVLIDEPANFSGYAPQNADSSFRGPIPADAALRASRNMPAITLAKALKPDLYDFLERAEVPLPFDRAHYGLSIVLGSAEITMEDAARLYDMLANDGLMRPIGLRADEGAHSASSPILSPEAAFVLRQMLASRGESRRIRGRVYPLLYKTGTSNGFRDAWTAGLVGPYVVVVWIGNFDGRSNANFQGATLAAPLFRAAAERLVSEPALDWPESYALGAEAEAKAKGYRVSREEVCRATGDINNDLCPVKTKAWFIPGKSPVRDSGVLREIWINPENGLRACRYVPGKTVSKAWEFWPTHFQEMFLDAGIVKRPPPLFEPGCESEDGGAAPGKAPVIVSPEKGVAYYAGTAEHGQAAVMLRVGTEPDSKLVHWFDGNRYLTASRSGKAIEWRFAPGRHVLTAVDDQGRTSKTALTVKRP